MTVIENTNVNPLELTLCDLCPATHQDHANLGLCLAEDDCKEGLVVRSLMQHGTASKV